VIYLGEEKINPLVLTATPDNLAVDINLEGLKRTLEIYEDMDEGDSPEAPTPSTESDEAVPENPDEFSYEETTEEDDLEVVTSKGTLQIALQVNGDSDVTVSAGVIEKIELEVLVEENPIRLALEPSNPALSLRLEPLAGMVSFLLDLGSLDLSIPFKMMTDDDTSTGDLDIHLSGLGLDVTLDNDGESLSITNVGIGAATSTLKRNGTTLLGLDLNEAIGRTFDLSVAATEESPQVTLSPALNFSVLLNFQSVADQLEDIPDFMLNETVSINAGGETGITLRPEDEAVCEGDGLDTVCESGLKIINGELELTSTTADNPLIATANQCVYFPQEPRSDESHELLSAIAVAPCSN